MSLSKFRYGEIAMKKRVIAGALTAFVLLVSGCGHVTRLDTSVSSAAGTTVQSETTSSETETSETTVPSEPFVFNAHLHSDLLSEVASEEMWESLYNLIDAIRAGEDTFECSDEHAYKWCTDDTTIGTFLPPACTLVTGDGYSDGTGKIKYLMDKDEFLARESEFETEIERILNEAIRSDYSDFEKVMGLYDYMCQNFVYDYSDIDGQGIDDFGSYACLMKKNGICCEIAYVYAYLLLQAGVEATPYGSSCYHDWTFVKINGKGYHVDPTWALHGEYPGDLLYLQYFMMTEAERMEDPQITKESLEADMIWPWLSYYDITRFEATDETFKVLHSGCFYMGMNTERNVIYYKAPDGNIKELSYGDM